jgi:cytidylate kinase
VLNVIAIDGPAASGKSTVAKRVAKTCDYIYVDSGALYRAVTWVGLCRGVAGKETDKVIALLDDCNFTFFVEDGAIKFSYEGTVPVEELRTAQINENVSPVAAVPEVRERVVAWLRDMSRFGRLVMEGRDIGTNVFPGADMKFYLDASPEERARRRHGETREDLSVSEVGESIARRDTIDRMRRTHPLSIADDADVIDTTRLSIDDVVSHVVGAIEARQNISSNT